MEEEEEGERQGGTQRQLGLGLGLGHGNGNGNGNGGLVRPGGWKREKLLLFTALPLLPFLLSLYAVCPSLSSLGQGCKRPFLFLQKRPESEQGRVVKN